MSIFNKGRICVKIAGRDAGLKCVVVEEVDNAFVVVDGQTRRRKVNVSHLEPLDQTLDVKGGSREDVKAAFKTIGIELVDKKSRVSKPRIKKQKVNKKASKKTAKVDKKTEKKEAKSEKKAEAKVEKKAEVKTEKKVEAKVEKKAEVKIEEKPVVKEEAKSEVKSE
jgi:large subunit ribosomal protein L14e